MNRVWFRALLFLALGWSASAWTRGQERAPVLPPNHAILVAAQNGKLPEVIGLLSETVTVNSCTEFGDTAMGRAIQSGRLDVARELMRRGFNPTATYNYSGTGNFTEIGLRPLVYASSSGAEDIVDELLKRGITAYPQVFARDSFIDSPALAAIKGNHGKILRKLLQSMNPDIAVKEVHREQYQYLAACTSTEMIDILLEYGADVNASDRVGPWPSVLDEYAKRGWREGVTYLLRWGADPTKTDQNQKLAEDYASSEEIRRQLRFAVVNTHVEHVRGDLDPARKKTAFATEVIGSAITESEAAGIARLESVSRGSLDVTDDRGWTLLNYALRYRYLKLASALVEKGADVSHMTEKGSVIIGFATETGDTELVKRIVAKGADVNVAEKGMNSPLNTATNLHDLPMIEVLLSLGAKVDPPRPTEPNVRWQSALMLASKAGDIALMERLLKAGGDLQAVDSWGENVIYYAVRSGNVAALNWLLNQGAYPFMKTPRGTNALTLAASLGKLEMVKALVGLGLTHPDAVTYARQATGEGARSTLQYLLKLNTQRGPNDPANFWDEYKRITKADVACYIEAGGDINYADGVPTPLQQMTQRGDVESVKLLLEKGADPAKRGQVFTSPVFLVFLNRKDDQALPLLRLYIEHGISPDTREFIFGMEPPEKKPTGGTLLCSAVALGDLKCARFLLEAGSNPWLINSLSGHNAFDCLLLAQNIDEKQRLEFRVVMEEFAKKFPRPDAEPESRPVAPARKEITL